MADLSAFSSDNFVTIAWVNNALKEKQDEEGMEPYLASLAMKLHIISQDYSDQLETGMVEAISTMPRIMSEISRLEETLHSVESEISNLASQLRALDHKNVAGIEDLSRLDTLKSNMENCKSTLEEHARWSQLVREAKSFLESGGRLTDSAERIEIMNRSLEILQNIPGHEERQETFQQLSDILLSVLRPRVRRDIVGFDLSPLHEYLYVYDKMGRRQELEEEYIKARPQRLRSSWESLLNQNNNLTRWLSDYYSNVVSLLEDESRNVESLFGKDRCPTILSAILTFAVGSISQTLSNQLKNSMSTITAVESYHITDDFAKRAIRSFDNSDIEKLLEVLSAIFSGFFLYVESYGDEEAKYLRSKLSDSISKINFGSEVDDNRDDFFDAQDPYDACTAFSERLVDAADNCVAPIELCLQRAVKLMGGVKTKIVFRTAASVFTQFIKQLVSKIDELSIACGVQLSDKNMQNSVSTAPKESISETGGIQNSFAVAESIARNLETHEGSRPLIQCALRAVQATGRLTRRIREIESISASQSAILSNFLFRDTSSLDRSIAIALNSDASIGSALAAYSLHQDFSAASELRSFLASSTSIHASQTVFSTALNPLARCKTAAGVLLFELCTNAPEKIVADLSSDNVWMTDVEESSSYSLDNLLPQQAFTLVGEHMLSLVQELETFASSDALSDLLNLSGDAQQLAIMSRGWKNLKAILELGENDNIDNLCKRIPCQGMLFSVETELFGSVITNADEQEHVSSTLTSSFLVNGIVKSGEEDAAILAFVNEWLGFISDAIIGLIVAQILKIQKLSRCGAAQLAVDIEYISNVVQAMGLRSHPLLSHIRHFLLADLNEINSTMESLSGRFSTLSHLQKLDLKLYNSRK